MHFLVAVFFTAVKMTPILYDLRMDAGEGECRALTHVSGLTQCR